VGRPDLSVDIAGLRLANPLIAASGCFGYGVEYADLVDLSALGAVAVKGLFWRPARDTLRPVSWRRRAAC
jgi:dihydroorotate dehydrogenase (NAD+) catalytic subunit